ncbi:hypothetical protein ACJMK2_002095 [Sinanodonta woodiana]|uniref:C2H2-type domain-containing protein n=1 Tax=Sinanodonta woodiana TaxID=1069815 RepID=A0ABD3XUT5_SINWO
MFSKAVSKCWVCPAEFARRRELKNHLAAAPHSRLCVVCVFCTDEEKVFRRMVDLKQHVVQSHPKVIDDVLLDFFGEGNGFWMALHPKDYNQIVGASSRESSAAVQARVRLLIWVGKCPNTSRTRIEWQRGWEVLYNTGVRRPIRTLSVPVQKETNQKMSSKSGHTSSESAFIPDYQDDIEVMMSPPYSPSRPEIRRELTIHHIKIYSPNSVVEVFDKISLVWYKVDIRCHDERDVCSIVRKKMAVTSDSCRTFPDGEGSQEMSEDVKREIVALLGVSKVSLVKIIRFIPPTFGLGSKRKELSEIRATSTKKARTPTPIEDPSAAVSTCSIAPVTVQASRSGSCTPLQDEHILDLSLRKDTPARPSKLYTSSTQPVLANKARAAKLLEKGCMPLFPPARREWQDDTVITIPTGSSRLLWPPKNWKQMSPDQKLLQWEYASMIVENYIDKPLPSSLHRGALLDKFNMLALPGTSVPIITEEQLINRKANYYNYEILRSIAIGSSAMEDLTATTMLTMYEAAAKKRETTIDILVELIQQAGVTQRLVN